MRKRQLIEFPSWVIRDRVEPAASPGMVRYAAESGSELSYRDATGTNTMAETVTIDRPSVAKPVSRLRSAKPATVSASALALHLDCSRTYIGKLEAEGVIQRQGDGFPLDQSRVAYLRYLRRERRQSPRSAADAEHTSGEDRHCYASGSMEEAARAGAADRCRCTDRRDRRCHADRIVEPACAVCAAW